MADKLTVSGLSAHLDGEYEFDIADLLSIGGKGALTNRESHRIKQMAGVRAGELEDALRAGDTDVLVAIAAVVLARAGKTVDEDLLWDAPIMSGLRFEIGGDDGPPAEAPETGTERPPTDGGGSSSDERSEPQESDPSRTGPPPSDTSSTSDPSI